MRRPLAGVFRLLEDSEEGWVRLGALGALAVGLFEEELIVNGSGAQNTRRS
jgi:hypothetical protein